MTAPQSEAMPRLAVLSDVPFNAETVLNSHPGVITPIAAFYKRNHFPIPQVSVDTWRLSVDGEAASPIELCYADLLSLPMSTLMVTLECAGNGRTMFDPPADGEPWNFGAASTAEWTGVRLSALLGPAGVRNSAIEIVADGADSGYVDAAGETISYSRSLPMRVAEDPDTLIALFMNGEPLPADHGSPARLIVPGWYGMAAVKWLVRLTAIAEPFQGFYQADRYVMNDGVNGIRPLQEAQVRALFSSPGPGSTIPCRMVVVRGFAWSGYAPVTRVDVSLDGGSSWKPASTVSEAHRYAWRRWEFRWAPETPGEATLLCRATDAEGNTQPSTSPWNRLGYCNNGIQSLTVTVE